MEGGRVVNINYACPWLNRKGGRILTQEQGGGRERQHKISNTRLFVLRVYQVHRKARWSVTCFCTVQ